MMHVQDLKLREEVLPLFNFTNNEHAESRLLRLLQEVPETAEAVLERQAVVQGMLANWAVLENFTYRRLDLIEVHAYFETIRSRREAPTDGKWTASLKLMLSETERNRLRSRLVQLVLLLTGLQRQYLVRLNKAEFPEHFKKQLQNANAFLNKLRLEAHATYITEDTFTTQKLVDFTRLLYTLDPTEIKQFWDFFFTFEAYWSVAKGTVAKGFAFAAFSNDTIRIENLYHPLLKHPVKNNLQLNADGNVLLLTGPNMSGKSTLLKAVGLCVYLARVGFPVPATTCQVPFFSTIAIAINLNDSLRDGYSHFKAELENLKAVVQATAGGAKCFAIFDELFRGTNTDDALDITRATVTGLSNIKGSFFLISTHLLQLEEQLEGASSSIRKCYIECILEDGNPTFSYSLKEGLSQLKIGRILFDKEGLASMFSTISQERNGIAPVASPK